MKKSGVLTAVILALAVSGCGKKDSQAHYEDAQRYIESQQYNAAVIELKSAIQQAPDNPDYRLALGMVYLQQGDNLSAEKELERARRNGIEEQRVALPLIQAAFRAGQYPEILSQYSKVPAGLNEAEADYIRLYQAMAELELGAPDNASDIFEQLVRSEKPDVATFAQSNLLIPVAEHQAALALLENTSKDSPIYQEVLMLRGSLQLATNAFAQAADSFVSLLEAQPRNFRARLLASQALIRDGRFADADKQLTVVLKALPEQAYANYLKSLVEFENQNYTKAKEFADKAINNGYRASQARIIAGISAWRLGLDTQAMHNLAAIERQLDAFPPAKRLYIALQLKSGQVSDASSALGNMELTEQDLQLIATAATALVQQGSNSAAAELIARYDNIDGNDIESLTRLGALKLTVPGQEKSGIADLEQALLLDPSQQQTRLILASSYLKAGEYDKVTALADEWLADPETAVLGYNLKAYTAMLQQQTTDAEKYLQQALAADKTNPFTRLLIAVVDSQQQRFQEAKTVLDALLAEHPLYLPAIAQSFAVQNALGDTSGILRHTHKQLEANPEHYQLRMALAGYYYSRKQYAETLQLLKDSDTSQPLPVNHWTMLIESYEQQQQSAEAEKVAAAWYQQGSNRQLSTYIYANFLSRQQKYNDALRILNEQLRTTPADLPTITTKLMVLSQQQKYKEALSTLNALPADLQQRADLRFLRARIELLDNQPEKALTSFRQSYDVSPTADTAGFIASLLKSQNKAKDALAFLDQHLAAHQGSTELNLLRSELLLQLDSAKAEESLRSIVQSNPDNIVALNNLAWTLMEQKKLPEALNYAEQAVRLAPENPDILDTYGKILSVSGKHRESLTAFEKSLQVRPDNLDVLLNYAEALALNKNHQQAREVLQKIKATDQQTEKKVSYISGLLDN